MAGEAFRLVIPQDMLNKLQAADDKLKSLGNTSENTRNRVTQAFGKMTGGVQAFINKLNEAQQRLDNLSNFKGANINLGNVVTRDSVANIDKLIEAINQLSQKGQAKITINGIDATANQAVVAVDSINKLIDTLVKLQQMGGQNFTATTNLLGKETLKQMNSEARKMSKTIDKLDEATQRYASTAGNLSDKIRQAREAQRQFNEEAKRAAQTSVGDLMSGRGKATTLNELKAYANQLKTTMANLYPKSKEWQNLNRILQKTNKDIQRINESMGAVRRTQSNLMNHAQQLRRALALVFSVSQITGYVNKMIQIRGEFELQQRSLQAILQNKDEADKLWQQTVDLAVRSPFRVKELVSYTKQLAAYRVETEKLHDTTKMLSDVSAGLGVDMQRLILAFGQVKAANYLRGTELRQFSEAGINILGELAKYFTELEGRAVSVGEVFERVSKRMVAFSDVEEIFKRVTSDGGVFYRMQEIQSETVKGLISNLYDQVDLMLNDIGKSNDGALKGAIGLVKTLVENWRTLAPYIKTAGESFALYFGVKTLANIGKGFATLWATISAHPIAAAVTAISFLVIAIYNAVNATDELTSAMLEVEKSVSESLEESIGLYRELTDTINDSTKSLDERNKAYEKLKTKFKDILPDQQLELEYIQDLKFSYKEAEDAMFSYYNAKAIEQKKSKIESLYEEGFATDEKDLIKGLKTYISESGRFTNEEMVKLRAGINKVVSSIIEDVKKGKIDASYASIYKALRERMTEFSGVEFEMQSSDDAGVRKVLYNIRQIIDSAKDYKEALSDIGGLPFQTYEQQQAYNAIQEHNKEMENAVSLYKHLVSLRQKLADNKVDLTSDKSTLNEKQLQDREWYLNDLNNTLNEINKLSPDVANGIKEIDKSLVSAAEKGSYEFAKSLGVAENALYNIFADKAKTLKGGNEGASAMLTNFAEGIKANAESKLATPLQQAIISAFDLAIKERDIDQKGKDLLAKLLPDSKQTTEDVRKSVEALLKQYQDEVKKWENATAAGATKLPFVEYLNQFGNTEFKSAISQYLGSTEDFKNLEQKMIPVLEHIYQLLGGDPDKDKKGRDLVDERLRVIKEIYKAYKELNKTFDETTSKTGAMEKFGDAFYAAFGKTPEQMGYNLFTAQGVVDAYNKFISTLSKADDITKGNLAKGEFKMELQVEMQQKKDKAFRDQIEQMFSGYELAIELDKLNIPPDLAKQLFNVDTFDLSEIRSKVEQELYRLQTQGGGKDQIKEMEDFLKKVSKMEQDEQEERLKKYIAFSRKAMSERAKIKFEELRTIAEIEKTFAIKESDSEEVKAIKRAEEAKAKAKAKKDANDALQKLDWEDFKSSDTFNNIFDNLDNASDEVLKKVINRLKDFKEQWKDMPFDQMRQVVDLTQKAEEALKESDNPFTEAKRLKKAIKEDGRSKEQAQLDVYNAELQKKLAENALSNYELFEKVANEQIAVNTLTTEQLKEYVYWQELSVEEQKNLVEEMKNEVSYQDDVIKKGNKQQNNIKKLTNVYKKQEDSINQINKLTQDLYGSFMDLAENGASLFGKELDGTTKIFADMGASMADTVLQTVALWINLKSVEAGAYAAGTALNTAMGVIGWIVMGVQLLSQAFKAIVDAHDNGLQKQIDAEAKSVERLQKVYEDLEEQIKNTYDINEFNRATKAAQDNLLAQIAATERIISAEEDKKKSDQDAIDDYKDEIDDLKNSYKELEETRLQELGAFATDENKKSGAEAFLDAWMEAYKQTGDGLSGLNEQFDEFFEDSVKRQMLQKATSRHLENLFNKYDAVISDWADGKISDEELYEKLSGLRNDLPALNEALEKWAEAVGISAEFAGKNAELSGLSAGIQGITAEQADVLASYWNSVRFYTADTNAKFTDLITRLFDSEGSSNPMLAELRAQTAFIQEIRDVLGSVVGRGGTTHSGAFLKVAIG